LKEFVYKPTASSIGVHIRANDMNIPLTVEFEGLDHRHRPWAADAGQ